MEIQLWGLIRPLREMNGPHDIPSAPAGNRLLQCEADMFSMKKGLKTGLPSLNFSPFRVSTPMS